MYECFPVQSSTTPFTFKILHLCSSVVMRVLRVAHHCSPPLVVWGFSFKWLWSIYICTDEHFLKSQDKTHLIYFVSSVILLFLFMLIVAIVLCFLCLYCPSNNGGRLMEMKRQKGKKKSNVRTRQRECNGVMDKIQNDKNKHVSPQRQGSDHFGPLQTD